MMLLRTVNVAGALAVPIPTFPFAPTKRAVAPVVVWVLNTLPVPNCLTVSAFADTALPVTRTALEFMSVGTAVPEFWLKLIEYYYLARFVCVTYSDGTGGHTIANGSDWVVTSLRA
jgi:hypothetical protein